ncbi:MAG: hypothetical protein A2W31_15690 [Planctomycetes bacterium RBG_16_64_10]|nr:MAG: hypothetical protein A2W31_15690 [Planctomycetes bacterium RBG_16_64_10]
MESQRVLSNKELIVGPTGLNFGFFAESAVHDGQADNHLGETGPGPTDLTWLEVPAEGVSFLVAAGTDTPRVVSGQPIAGVQVGLLESIRYEQQLRLLLAPTSAVRINGLAAPPVVILDPGDRLRIAGDWLLHVARLLRPTIGPPSPDYVGQECPICRGRFTPQTVVYICPQCGRGYHCESATDATDECGDAELLECARMLSVCAQCPQPVVLEEQYDYVPRD